MRKEIQKWNSITLQMHNASMFDSLIHSHNLVTESCKQFQFMDKNELEFPEKDKGYFAMKDVDGKKTKYFIPDDIYPQLPVRIDECDEVLYKDSTRVNSFVLMPTAITPFRVKPEKMWEDNHEFINELAPFEHSNPDAWTINKITAVMGYVGKTFIGLCSPSEFGKSSIYLILDAITKKCPVYQPRSVPGVLAQITCDGNMIFDETHDAPSDVMNCMENFSLQVAGNAPIYVNGAMKSANTKAKYDVSQQSITYLYNVYSNYRDPEKQFFDYVWKNKKAMDSRFLKLKLDGKLLEQFDKDFNIPQVAEENKMYYMRIAKHLLYLKELKKKNSYMRRYKTNSTLNFDGRHKSIYDELTWGIDLYCKNQAEYDKFIDLLEKALIGYKLMLGQTVHQVKVNPNPMPQAQQSLSDTQFTQHPQVVEEEIIEDVDEPTKLLQFIQKNKIATYAELENLGLSNLDEMLKNMIGAGDIYECSRGKYKLLE